MRTHGEGREWSASIRRAPKKGLFLCSSSLFSLEDGAALAAGTTPRKLGGDDETRAVGHVQFGEGLVAHVQVVALMDEELLVGRDVRALGDGLHDAEHRSIWRGGEGKGGHAVRGLDEELQRRRGDGAVVDGGGGHFCLDKVFRAPLSSGCFSTDRSSIRYSTERRRETARTMWSLFSTGQ